MEKSTELFYWGNDKYGQLGIGDRSIGKIYLSPRCCSFNVHIKKISCGEDHSCFISSNGYIYSMGSNSYGKLGINNPGQKYSPRPTLIESLTDYQVIDISCGYQHTGAVTTSGITFVWGQGTYGQLGVAENECSWAPLQLQIQHSAKRISCGGRHSALLLNNSNKNLCVWGAGDSGQLGIGNRDICNQPFTVNIGMIKDVACGAFHTLILSETGELYASGANTFGQLGIGTKESTNTFVRVSLKKEVIKIAAGQHSACVTKEGELYIWGNCGVGDFLTPYKLESNSKIANLDIGVGYGVALDNNGLLWTWGSSNSGCLGSGYLESRSQPIPVIELQGKTVTQISCGSNFVIALGESLEKQDFKKNIDTKENQELLACLGEMKKEIARLQKGTGGLEDLSCKLEQSKIKQGHLHSLYIEEQRQKQYLEENIKKMTEW